MPARDYDDALRRLAAASSNPGPQPPRAARPWLGVRFTCADAYVRALPTADRSAYAARCPRCGRVVNFRVGPGGCDARLFTASCDGT